MAKRREPQCLAESESLDWMLSEDFNSHIALRGRNLCCSTHITSYVFLESSSCVLKCWSPVHSSSYRVWLSVISGICFQSMSIFGVRNTKRAAPWSYTTYHSLLPTWGGSLTKSSWTASIGHRGRMCTSSASCHCACGTKRWRVTTRNGRLSSTPVSTRAPFHFNSFQFNSV